MKRKISTGNFYITFSILVLFAAGAILLSGSKAGKDKSINAKDSSKTETTLKGDCSMPPKITKTNEEWKEELSEEQYYVTRQKGTERAFTGKYLNNKEKGVYKCVACGAELFSSETKYESGSGWPSFYAPMNSENIGEKEDFSFNMQRKEIVCSNCGAHLGHVFEDGPQPTGLRYCVNSASLDFEKKVDVEKFKSVKKEK